MPKTTIPCPRCRTPITAEITRLFDLSSDPEAKEKLLSGSANLIDCPVCHYQGVYPSPIVYHDADKELLLTYFPPESNLPLPEQEKIIGPLIKKVVDTLPPEKRKGYLFRPQTMLTQQLLFETILKADGITPEMMKAQQEKLVLISQLAAAAPDKLPELIAQNDDKIDEQVFLLISRLAETSAAGGDQEGVQILANLQQSIVEHSSYGKSLAEQARESQAAVRSLQELSQKGLTRESLLALMIESADSDVRLTTLVTMARGGLDYTFFEQLSAKIDAASGEEKDKLSALREKLLELSAAVDDALKAQMEQAQALLDEILKAENIEEAAEKALPRVNQAFVDVVNHAAQHAQAEKDQATLEKLMRVIAVVQAASQSGAALQLIEILLQAKDESARQQVYEKAGDAIDAEFLQMLNELIGQMEKKNEQAEALARLKDISREALRFSMQRNFSRNNTA
ncbi:MAG TPA: CpXC domain-containing protein [Anaerolineaceae bacterium]|nr:CpXC domain-containing protein [Anaerolineaceae bacterium]HQK42921.1 CpXC domain-containing protein [Anaerolineaceae bacterium]